MHDGVYCPRCGEYFNGDDEFHFARWWARLIVTERPAADVDRHSWVGIDAVSVDRSLVSQLHAICCRADEYEDTFSKTAALCWGIARLDGLDRASRETWAQARCWAALAVNHHYEVGPQGVNPAIWQWGPFDLFTMTLDTIPATRTWMSACYPRPAYHRTKIPR